MNDETNELMSFNQPPVRRDLAFYDAEVQPDDSSAMFDIIKGLLRRWKIIVLIFLIIAIPGVAFVWLVVQPGYETEGAIEVTSPTPIIFKIQDETFSNTETFMRTEAVKITSPPVLNRAVDVLRKKNLEVFSGSPNMVETLQKMISSDVIFVGLEKGTNLIKIIMAGTEKTQGDARETVDAMINAYISVRADVSTQGELSRLSYLETQMRIQKEKLQMQRAVIRRLAEEYGTTNISARQQVKFEYVARLQSTLNEIETKRIAMESQRELLRDSTIETIDPEKQIAMRFGRINTDPTVQMFTSEVTSLERQLIVARQNFAPENPELDRMEKTYDAMKERLDERRNEVGQQFDDDLISQMEKISAYKTQDIESELKSLAVHEKRISEKLEKEDQKTRELGQKQLAIMDEQEKLSDIKELLETIKRRITQLEMEGKRPATITVAYYASSLPAKTKQIQYTLVCIFGALGAGVAVSFLAEKADPRLRTTKDIVREVGIPIIGTTSQTETLKKTLLPSIVAEDYRTIRANLGLLNPDGIPKKIVITSAGIREGKTTFSINLATSMAKSGKRILLIDGDLRKPDIAKALKIPQNRLGLQDIMAGKSFDEVVCRDCIPGLDVLISSPCAYDPSMACEILGRFRTINLLDDISNGYDHLIIDTPPVLAGPDSMLWTKMSDGVIIASYSGHTVKPDIQEAIKRLRKIGANILGSVLHSVETDNSYYRYGYDYYTSGQTKKDKKRAENRPLLLTIDELAEQSNATEPEA